MGLTLGFRTVDTFWAVPTERGMLTFTSDFSAATVDLALTLGYDPMLEHAPVAAMSSTDRKLPPYAYSNPAEEPKAYSISDGAIMDLSWRFSFHLVDDSRNDKLYGAGTTAHEILNGEVQIPEEFLPLYKTIAEVRRSGWTRRLWYQCEMGIEHHFISSVRVWPKVLNRKN